MKICPDLVEAQIQTMERIALKHPEEGGRAAARLVEAVLLQVFDVLDDPLPEAAIGPANWRDSL